MAFSEYMNFKTKPGLKEVQIVKFGYSEKATKFEKIFHIKFDVTE